ncbi:MAG: MlaD family protein [Alphaproteobacteria bacterium]|nr:MlaD family protein [Alphaproteobacteria bacterium]
METRASYLIVGLFVIAGMIGLVFAAMWITGTRTDEAVALYDIYFDGNVSGLKPGNVVQYRGIPVGGVVDMRIDPDNVERVLVTIEVDADTPIREDTEATLALQGITGLSYIQLTGGTQAAAELKAATGQRRPVIKSRPSELAAIFEAAPELLNRAIGVIAQLEKLLGPENQGHIGSILENIEDTTGVLADSGDDISTMLKEGARVMEEMRKVTTHANVVLENIEGDVGAVADDTRAVLGSVKVAVARLAVASDQFATFMTENNDSLTNFSQTGLYEFSQLMAEARVLVAALSRLTEQVERDPARFLFGDRQQGVEVQ